jgi:hypothetical protein
MENTKIRFLKITLLILYLINTCSCQPEKSQMRGNDWRLFKDTKAWDFAKAVRNQETSSFESLINEAILKIDFEEEIFGQSLLHLAVTNNLSISVKKLLELGADPNHSNSRSGETVMHNAVGVFQDNDDTTILKYLIENGGDPNGKILKIEDEIDNRDNKSVIYALCSNAYPQINKLKLLIKSGVSLEIKEGSMSNFLDAAIRTHNYKLVLLLLQSGVEYRKVIVTRFSGEKKFIQDCLKQDLIDLESEAYQDKLKVINFLEKQGIDYRNTKPSDWLIQRAKQQMPDTWEDYLSKF